MLRAGLEEGLHRPSTGPSPGMQRDKKRALLPHRRSLETAPVGVLHSYSAGGTRITPKY